MDGSFSLVSHSISNAEHHVAHSGPRGLETQRWPIGSCYSEMLEGHHADDRYVSLSFYCSFAKPTQYSVDMLEGDWCSAMSSPPELSSRSSAELVSLPPLTGLRSERQRT